MDYKRLPIHTYNTRDLGGIPVTDGVTDFHVFVRSDALTNLGDEDIDFLVNYGITDIIDLREPGEREMTPDPADPRIKNHGISLSVDNLGDITAMADEDEVDAMNLKNYYLAILESKKEAIRQVFQVIFEARGGVLFHCAVGKDRTGIIAMLLLGLAGASEADIVADYATTSIYLLRSPRFSDLTDDDVPEMVSSKAGTMTKVLHYLKDHYGSVEGYLRRLQIPQSTLDHIHDSFITAN